jgi:ABC-2 type transport system permease protein
MKAFVDGLFAVAAKETLHMLRDRLTLALLLTVPLVQILLFGYAIELHPKNLPTALLAHENDEFATRAARELEGLGYFHIVARTSDAREADRWLAQSRVQFVLRVPQDLGLKILSGGQVQLTLIADATDPVASIVATQAAAAHYGKRAAGGSVLPVKLDIEQRYNAEGASRLFIVPGLLGVVLTLTLVLLAALSFVREREHGTFETLATLPIPRSALLLGKLAPYFVLGCLLFLGLLVACIWLIGIAWPGLTPALAATAAGFVAANLALGIALSLIARNQMQAMQLGVFFYLPSMLLSGFMFPFHGMPAWAQNLGELLPLTHFLRVVRGVMLKDLPDAAVWPLAWPIAAFAVVAALTAFMLYRKRLS